MSEEYFDTIVMEFRGQEVPIVKFNQETETGRKPVKTMNRKRRASGYTKGITTYKLSITYPVPVANPIKWADVVDETMSFYPPQDPSKRTTFTGCCVEKVGLQYQLEGETVMDISLFALDEVTE